MLRQSIKLLFFLFCVWLLTTGVTAWQGPPRPERTFTIGLASQDLSFDPLHAHTSTEIQILTALYEGLVTYHPLTLETLPGMAYRWDISDDKTVYTFHIRENARYSNGDPVTAAQFRDTFLRILDPKEKAEYSVYLDVIKGARAFREGRITSPQTVGLRVLSDKILEITLEKPASHFLKVLCLLNFAPVHPSYREPGKLRESDGRISNGPFVISEQTKETIVFSPNQFYWDRDQLKIDSIQLRLFADSKVLAQHVNSGDVDWTSLQSADYGTLDNRAREHILPNPMFATSFLFFVCREKPFDDPRVRQGLAQLIPWNELRSREYSLYPTSRLVPEIPKYPVVKGIGKQDVEEGLKLLEEAGYPKGKGLPPITILVSRGNTLYADMLAKAWEDKLEVKVVLKEVDGEEFFSAVGQHDYTVSSYTWIGDFADPLAFLQMWTSDSNLNEALYRNPTYDSLIDQSLSVIGLDRYQKLAEAEELLLQEGTILPIDHIAAFNVIDIDLIGGWFPNPLDIHPLKYIEIREGKLNKWIVKADNIGRN
ncbi:MAG TPA: peptide ABC transporter substrate-binding protein [Spirochaetia bacterium]|nr:peptide ABC transporter substrate-binding protein [Spirochaetia bacterium]